MREMLFFVYRIGEECHVACTFHGVGEHALVRGAGTRFLAWVDLCLHGHEVAQESRVFIVDPLDIR